MDEDKELDNTEQEPTPEGAPGEAAGPEPEPMQEQAEEMVDAPSEQIFSEDLSDLEAAPLDQANGDLIGTHALEFLFDLELPISVELAKKELQIQDIVNLGEGSIVEFDKLAGETVDVLVNNKKIAEGEVVVIDERFGVRILNLINPTERLKGIAQEMA